MSECPCYRAIYSAVPRMPAAVVEIISGYGHTFSDSALFRILETHTVQFLDINHSRDMSAHLGNFEYNESSLLEYPYATIGFSGRRIRRSINLMYIAHDSGSGPFFWSELTVRITSPRWESIVDHLVTQREKTWCSIRRDVLMPPEFIQCCDMFIKILGDQLGKENDQLMCPRLLDPTHKNGQIK